MKKTLPGIFLLLATMVSHAQDADEKAVRGLLDQQRAAWNRGDIDGFMKGYWQSDSLKFIGKSGITYGWSNTLRNYKRSYPDTGAMGQLLFTIYTAKKLSKEYYFVIGKWELTRTAGNMSGHFTLLVRKIKGKWVIVADHSS